MGTCSNLGVAWKSCEERSAYLKRKSEEAGETVWLEEDYRQAEEEGYANKWTHPTLYYILFPEHLQGPPGESSSPGNAMSDAEYIEHVSVTPPDPPPYKWKGFSSIDGVEAGEPCDGYCTDLEAAAERARLLTEVTARLSADVTWTDRFQCGVMAVKTQAAIRAAGPRCHDFGMIVSNLAVAGLTHHFSTAVWRHGRDASTGERWESWHTRTVIDVRPLDLGIGVFQYTLDSTTCVHCGSRPQLPSPTPLDDFWDKHAVP